MTMTIEELLEQRRTTHGDYASQAPIVEQIIDAMRGSPNWATLPDTHRVAIYMVAFKLGRIASGNFDEPDHWRDIAGYAKLVEREINATGSSSTDK